MWGIFYSSSDSLKIDIDLDGLDSYGFGLHLMPAKNRVVKVA
jgi:hypothetical protein